MFQGLVRIFRIDFRILFAYIGNDLLEATMHLTRRQREIYEFLKDHIRTKGYAPSIMEVGQQFDLSSPATVHKHLSHLEEKGLIRRDRNLSRAIELIDEPAPVPEYPLLGHIAAGRPIDAIEAKEMVALLPDVRDKDVFVLKVKGDSMIEDHIQEGDYVIVEKREQAENGETVVALLDNATATLKRFYREKDYVRLQPANQAMDPIFVRDGDFQIQGVVISVLRKF